MTILHDEVHAWVYAERWKCFGFVAKKFFFFTFVPYMYLNLRTRACKRTNFFFFFFSLWCDISFFFPQEVNKCFPFIIIYYFARHSCIACIVLLNTFHSTTFFSSSAEIQTKVYDPRKERRIDRSTDGTTNLYNNKF